MIDILYIIMQKYTRKYFKSIPLRKLVQRYKKFVKLQNLVVDFR